MLLEAVPNFSEGRRADVCAAIAQAARRPEVQVLDLEMDADHHRSVLTLAGPPEPLAEAAFAAAREAVARIDLNAHRGQHPRMGAIDVLPFVPLGGTPMEVAVDLARRVGRRIGEELGVPVFLYEAAATRPDRRNLADVRKPQFEGLRELIGRDPDRAPDFGPPRIHPTAGCVAVGARRPLIAFNVDLDTEDVAVARAIARKVRERDGGLPALKALGLYLAERRCAQVSMNVCDYTRTGLAEAFRAVEAEAARLGAGVRGSEIVGLVPREALPPDPERTIRLVGFHPRQVLENRLA
ncbi:MAG TPA: glutamate formimidoyltransferase [Planctomycetota bacterium]|nr:glutamate formimidoyltransferase [Planctomycetota bacterium]